VVLSFDLNNSQALTEEQKLLLKNKLASKLTTDNFLILNCDEDRSQLKNKEIVIKRFLHLVLANLVVQKTRKPTKIPKSVIKKELKTRKSI